MKLGAGAALLSASENRIEQRVLGQSEGFEPTRHTERLGVDNFICLHANSSADPSALPVFLPRLMLKNKK
jgi:hypothetical protein